MGEKSFSADLLFFMKNISFMCYMFIGIVTADCLHQYRIAYNARGLLDRINTIPRTPLEMIILTIGLSISILLLISIEAHSDLDLWLKTIIELSIGVFLCSVVNFAYCGVLLLIMANTMKYIRNGKWRIILLAVICLTYLSMQYDIISLVIPMVSIQSYWLYYSHGVYTMLCMSVALINSVTLFCFVLYMLNLLLDQMGQKRLVLRLNQELEEKNKQLILMNQELEEATRTKERNRLAREIHDTLGHALTGIITGLDACITIMDIAPGAVKDQLIAIADVARGGMKDVRRSVNALRPDALERENLKTALEKLVLDTERSTGVRFQFTCDADLEHLNHDEEDVIYRIIQESTTNSIRHGKATKISVYIQREEEMLVIWTQDNGIGCKKVVHGFGLHHMEERVSMLQGSFEYDGSDGFSICVKIPIRWGKE